MAEAAVARLALPLAAAWIGLVLAIRILHFGAEPVRQEAATAARAAGRLEAADLLKHARVVQIDADHGVV